MREEGGEADAWARERSGSEQRVAGWGAGARGAWAAGVLGQSGAEGRSGGGSRVPGLCGRGGNGRAGHEALAGRGLAVAGWRRPAGPARGWAGNGGSCLGRSQEGKERRAGLGLGFRGFGLDLGKGLGSSLYLPTSIFLFLVLTQTKLDEFKLNFEFHNLKHTSKNKNVQHECNIKSRSMIDFNYL